jgi:hypothetical protein
MDVINIDRLQCAPDDLLRVFVDDIDGQELLDLLFIGGRNAIPKAKC